jgi:demethylmenaquinone methyltransferase/2-methoxy-6-polyprenyl-1,4-benzoquinol methylase
MEAGHGGAGESYYQGGKAAYVREMFAGIAHRYDLLNSVLSFNQHKAWRRKAVRLARVQPGDTALDVCAGTGDFAIDLAHAVGEDGYVVGADFCEPMLANGRDKTLRAKGGHIDLMVADALRLPYRSSLFDCATVGFGIRNVSDIPAAFREMSRVIRPGGRVVCLEFNRPKSAVIRAISDLYELRILPRIGGMLSRSEAYRYLPNSIQAFQSREELADTMRDAGLQDIRIYDLNFGAVCIHIGTKP